MSPKTYLEVQGQDDEVLKCMEVSPRINRLVNETSTTLASLSTLALSLRGWRQQALASRSDNNAFQPWRKDG